jgi:hypothetical protein
MTPLANYGALTSDLHCVKVNQAVREGPCITF